MPYRGPGIYRHYKGGEYEVLGLGVEEATLKPVVIYRPLKEGIPDDVSKRFSEIVEFWTRPLTNFNHDVLVPNDKDIEIATARFVFVSGPR